MVTAEPVTSLEGLVQMQTRATIHGQMLWQQTGATQDSLVEIS